MTTIRGSRRRAVLGLVVTAAVTMTSLSGCSALGGSNNTAASSANGTLEKSKVKVSIMSTIDTSPFQLAIKNGDFKQEGLDVEVVNAPSGQVSLQKLIGGEVDIAYSSYTPFFIAKSKGAADIKFIADASSAAPKSTEVVAMPNSSVKGVQAPACK